MAAAEPDFSGDERVTALSTSPALAIEAGEPGSRDRGFSRVVALALGRVSVDGPFTSVGSPTPQRATGSESEKGHNRAARRAVGPKTDVR
jgi:hypothetical protein